MDLTTSEAACLLGTTPRAVRRAICAGKLPARRKGRRWLLPEVLPCTLCGYSHARYPQSELNEYGDVEHVRAGWVQVPRLQARQGCVPCRHTIVTGWSDSGLRGYPSRPSKAAVVPAAWWRERQASRRPPPPDTRRARSLSLRIQKIRKIARARKTTADSIMDRVERLRAAAERRREREYVEGILARFPGEAPLDVALRALHAENRRAKHRHADRERIYTAKDRLLSALVRGGRAQVAWFRVEHMARVSCCTGTPFPSGEACYACGQVVTGELVAETWFLVSLGDGRFRFHVPPRSEASVVCAARAATRADDHDPTQEAREVPDTGMTADEHMAVLAYVSDLLEAEQHRSPDDTGDRQTCASASRHGRGLA